MHVNCPSELSESPCLARWSVFSFANILSTELEVCGGLVSPLGRSWGWLNPFGEGQTSRAAMRKLAQENAPRMEQRWSRHHPWNKGHPWSRPDRWRALDRVRLCGTLCKRVATPHADAKRGAAAIRRVQAIRGEDLINGKGLI